MLTYLALSVNIIFEIVCSKKWYYCYIDRGIRNIKQQLQQLGLIKTKTRNKETKTHLPINDNSDDDIKDESEVVPSQPILTTRVNRKGTS